MMYKSLNDKKWEDVLRDIRRYEETSYWGDPTPVWIRSLSDEMDSTGIYNPDVLTAAKNWVIGEMENRIETLYERLEGNE